MKEWLSGYTHNHHHSRQSFSVVLILWPHFLIINAIWINLFFFVHSDEWCYIHNFFFICQWEWAYFVELQSQCDSLHFNRKRQNKKPSQIQWIKVIHMVTLLGWFRHGKKLYTTEIEFFSFGETILFKLCRSGNFTAYGL